MGNSKIQLLLGPMRIPFLALTPVCVFLGLSVSIYKGVPVSPALVVLSLSGALAAHVAVNALNEYFDFRSGLDLRTIQTPFSGGSKTLPLHPEMAPVALWIGIAAVAITIGVGVIVWLVRGWRIVPLGLAGLLLILFYTQTITRLPLLCLIAPGLGFGPLMVLGTEFVLSGSYSWAGFTASAVPFFLVSDLLLLNQFPDQEADRSVGRRHLLIKAGKKTGLLVYKIFLISSYLALLAAVLAHRLPPLSLLGCLTVALAVPLFRTLKSGMDSAKTAVPLMARNVVIVLTTPLFTGIGILLGRWL